ncbi:Endonuclease/exonuclease/phosphatase [Hysterangium stoloniferum]|nr:Endonuclease/exonuclease/phosphatase [Hysterangium stoloniferum]
MPPKRSASSSKRKASPEVSEISDTESLKPVKKKTKRAKKDNVDNGQPTNLVIPVSISFPPKTDGVLRMSSWNVSGLMASMKKGFETYVKAEDADILVLTETKVNDKPNSFFPSMYPYQYWSISSTKGYAGTTVLCKQEPMSVKLDFPMHKDNTEAAKGRLIVLEYPNTWIIGTYVPNAGQNLKNIDYKATWNDAFAGYIHELSKSKPVIWMGDINCAPTSIDLSNSKANWNKTPGHTQVEVDGFKKILNSASTDSNETESSKAKLVDVWRHLHPELGHYTYFSYRFRCREKQIGWRLDMFIASEALLPRIKMCEIRSEIYGASDHCPVVLEIEGPL